MLVLQEHGGDVCTILDCCHCGRPAPFGVELTVAGAERVLCASCRVELEAAGVCPCDECRDADMAEAWGGDER